METVDIPWIQNWFAQLADECESVDDGEQSSVVSGGEGGDLLNSECWKGM